MKLTDVELKYKLQQMELRALLEITEAINANHTEEEIFRIFYFTLRGSFDMQKFALFTVDAEQDWQCHIKHGIETELDDFPEEIRNIEGIRSTEGLTNSYITQFEWVYPVRHENKVLAYMLLTTNFAETETPARLQDRLDFIQALTNIVIVAIENRKLVRRRIQEEAIQRELDMARGVQQLLLPTSLPQNQKLQVAATYYPHHQVGGDYYDFYQLGESTFLLCIADVSGKGMPAAILMSNFQAALRMLVRQGVSLEVMVDELNGQIFASSKGDNYITAFICLYNHNKKKLTYVNCGHIPPLLVHNAGNCQHLNRGTTMLGAFRKLPFVNVGEVESLEQFTLFSFTDGLSETFNPADEEFGVERIEDIVCRNGQQKLEILHDKLMEELDTHREDLPYADDITMLSCRFAG